MSRPTPTATLRYSLLRSARTLAALLLLALAPLALGQADPVHLHLDEPVDHCDLCVNHATLASGDQPATPAIAPATVYVVAAQPVRQIPLSVYRVTNRGPPAAYR